MSNYKSIKIAEECTKQPINVQFDLEKITFMEAQEMIEKSFLMQSKECEKHGIVYPEVVSRITHPDGENPKIPYFTVEMHRHTIKKCGFGPTEKIAPKPKNKEMYIYEGDECGFSFLFKHQHPDYTLDQNGKIHEN